MVLGGIRGLGGLMYRARTYHDTDGAWTLTAHDSEMVLPRLTCTSWEPVIRARAAVPESEDIETWFRGGSGGGGRVRNVYTYTILDYF